MWVSFKKKKKNLLLPEADGLISTGYMILFHEKHVGGCENCATNLLLWQKKRNGSSCAVTQLPGEKSLIIFLSLLSPSSLLCQLKLLSLKCHNLASSFLKNKMCSQSILFLFWKKISTQCHNSRSDTDFSRVPVLQRERPQLIKPSRCHSRRPDLVAAEPDPLPGKRPAQPGGRDEPHQGGAETAAGRGGSARAEPPVWPRPTGQHRQVAQNHPGRDQPGGCWVASRRCFGHVWQVSPASLRRCSRC